MLVIFAVEGIENICKSPLGAWMISLITAISVFANFSYGVRHDLMVAHLTDFATNSLMIWPYPLNPQGLGLFSITIISVSIIYPLYLIINTKKIFF